MRLTPPVNPLLCIAPGFRRRRSRLLRGVLLVTALAPGCATPPSPMAPPSPVVASRPIERPVAAVSLSAPEPVAPPELPPIIIHHADLHGRFESRQGLAITVRALLMMSKTRPEVGNKGVLYCAPPGAQGEKEWVPLGEVEVKTPLDADGRIQIKITGDDKKFVIPGGKKPTPLVKNTRIRLNWEW